MKDYLHIRINDWSSGDIDGFDVVYGLYDPEYTTSRRIFNVEMDITVGQNEKFFFLPGVTIPRIKLKDLYAQTKSKTVRDVTEATKIIVGRKSNDPFTDHYWKYWIKTEALKTLLTNIKDNPRNYNLDISTYNDCMDILDTYTQDIILGNYDLSKLCDAAQGADVINYEDYCHSSKSFYQIKPDYTDLYKAVQTITVYDEVGLISLLNGDDSTQIDEAMYESLKDMFESTDNDNHVLAMEIMANSNYHESLMYLCFLFKEYSHIISNQKSRNHVNFNSLTNYMGFSSPTYCSMDIDKVINVLMRENALTKENAIRILAEFKDEISRSGDTNHLKVSKITFGEAAMNYLLEKEKAKHESEHIE